MIMKGRYEILYLSIPMLILAYLYADKFTVTGLGETFASNLGLSYRAVMRIGLIIVAFITATVVLTVGMIPFLGLIVPNIISIMRGDNLQKNLPDTALPVQLFCLDAILSGASFSIHMKSRSV